MKQSLVLENWHPTSSPNNQKRHWRSVQKNHHVDRDTVYGAALQAGWVFVPGKVRLTVTFVYPRLYRVDADNLTARLKGCLDGLKVRMPVQKIAGITFYQEPIGFFEDDDIAHLELHVGARVEKGVKRLEIEMEPAAPDCFSDPRCDPGNHCGNQRLPEPASAHPDDALTKPPMFDKPKTTTYVAPATPIDVDQRYLLRVHGLTDLGPTKFPNPTDDPDNPTHRIQWDFLIADMNGEKVVDVDGQPWHYMDYTSSKTGKSSKAGGKTAVARQWMEAFMGKPLEDEEIGDDIADQLVGKTAVALFEAVEKESQNGEAYTKIKILKLSPRKGGTPTPVKPKPAPVEELAF